MTWKHASLDEIAEFVGRGKSPIYEAESDYPVLNQACIQHGKLELSKLKFVSKTHFEGLGPTGKTQQGDIFVNSTGTGTLGRIGYWDKDANIAFDGHVTLVRIKPGYEPRFFYYWLHMPEAQSQIQNDCISGSTNQIELSREAFRKIRVRYPETKREQARVAEVLVTADRAIEQTEGLIAKYQRMKTGLMQDLLTRGIDENGNLRDPSTHKFKPSPIGSVPEGWDVLRLADMTVKIVDGVHHTPSYVEHGIPFVTVKNLTVSSSIDLTDVKYICEEDHEVFIKRAAPRAGDVLVTKDGTLGVAKIVPEGLQPFSIFVSVALLRSNPAICFPELIWLFFESGAFETQLGYLSAGTGLKHIHLEHFRKFRLATPPLDEQDRIFQVLIRHEEQLRSEQSYLRKLRRLKAGLMQDLLTGRVSVVPLLVAGKEEEKTA